MVENNRGIGVPREIFRPGPFQLSNQSHGSHERAEETRWEFDSELQISQYMESSHLFSLAPPCLSCGLMDVNPDIKIRDASLGDRRPSIKGDKQIFKKL